MSDGQRLSSADAAWLHMDRPTNLMVINSVLLFDEPVDWERMRRVVQRRLVDTYPRFRQRIDESRLPLVGPSWHEDPEFELDHHLHHRALPAPGDDRALQELAGDLIATPLDRTKPLWNFYLVDGYGEGCAVIVRMHHCIADGIALARVMLSLTDTTRKAGIAGAASASGDAEDGARNGRRAGGGPLRPIAGPLLGGLALGRRVARTTVRQSLSIAAHPRHAGQLAGAIVRDGSTAVKLLLTPADAASAIKGDPHVSRRVAWTEPLELALVKRIAHDHDATVNDVLLAAVSGALRDYLKRRGGVVSEIQAIVPFNLRPLDEPVPRELGNRFGLVFLPLPVGVSGSYRRLIEVHRRMDEIKRSREAPVSYGILGAIGLTPLPIEQRIVDVFTGKGTAVMTNVPGPRRTVYFAGAPVNTVLVWAPTSGHIGMSVSIFSYRGAVTVGLLVDATLIPDPETITTRLEEELQGLAKLEPSVEPRRRARSRGSRPRR
jgi:diacylglycerol O-acyltransferase / wax synthase